MANYREKMISAEDFIDRITTLALEIAGQNADFYCTECLSTLDELVDITRDLVGKDAANQLKADIDVMLNDDEEFLEGGKNMTCKDCAYYWKEENEERACCHWTSRCPDDSAPCEEENIPSYDYEEEDFI